MDPILALPGLPPHEAAPLAPAPHRIVAQWPVGTFLENLAVLPDGGAVVSVLSEARLDAVTAQGEVRTLRRFEAPPTGLCLVGGSLFVAVGEPGAGEPWLWRIDPADGAGEPWMRLEGMVFANGVTPFAPGRLLIADSLQGAVHAIDLAQRRCAIWLRDERLRGHPAVPALPGANGLKRWGDEVSVSSTGRAELYRVAVRTDGSAGAVSRTAERLRVDDLAYDVEGRLYLTTHVGHSLDRLDREGRRVSLGGPAEGLAGSTACAFTPDGALLVTTTGGLVLPVDGAPQPARLVRLEVGAAGHPLERSWETWRSVSRSPDGGGAAPAAA